ncbi:hypothetical protein J3E69DRAFT_329598 [Trichoderma sp. SZMC 28015]
MARATHIYNAEYPIPSNVSTNDVIDVLHFHGNLLTVQPQLASYSEISSTEASDFDTYFDNLDYPVKVYKAIEKIMIIPGIGDWGKYPTTIIVTFQNTIDGLKSRAVASAGVVVTATYTINKANKQGSKCDTNDGDSLGDDSWILSQNVVLECSSWLMPFVKQNMEGAQRNMCQNLVKLASLQ